MKTTRILKPGQCPACRIMFAPTTIVIRSGTTVLCEAHRSFVTADSITAVGPWQDVRRHKAAPQDLIGPQADPDREVTS